MTIKLHDESEFFHSGDQLSLLILLSLWLISVLLTTALIISVILAARAVKSSFNRKLVLIHMYVLVVNVFVRACTALALSIFIPPVIRFCDCSTTISFITLYLILFNICFQLYIVASLAVFQLMIIKGKKKFVNYRTIGITLFIITVLTVILPIIFLGMAKHFTGEAASCHSTIG